ncbi:hypothetical protein [Afifella marina]|uniref:Uncharacterized protein n=1 Tax=Afifella marina DSM 2698 TaxID=1120955 RepID=A0A1G5N9B6_AFIMA|nr:hypothetical protein [Afifella marina]MBK1623094.1 hypothetical protein [Afifella marina DSM 2698]MBK1626088.1 hypothetical protein [Afifella marina]MBK5916966.1 hypothetical protein [Afifella marina]RAI21969.1 hypothetical protein CH311_04410 [Afifella marina DSM 2698]SCZ34035.1 hypothetical protein SAMN03080610_01624 [Afifella marina DSM 2698]
MKQIIIRAAVVVAISGMFAAPAFAEDAGLVNYLNAQTRAQVEAYKKSLGKNKSEKSSNPSGMGAGIRG